MSKFEIGDRVKYQTDKAIYYGSVETVGYTDYSRLIDGLKGKYYNIRVDNGNLACVHEDRLMKVDEDNTALVTRAIKKVIFNGDRTIIIWWNNAKTIVKCSADEPFDKYTGFCAAIVKELFGSTSSAQKFLKSVEVDNNKGDEDE